MKKTPQIFFILAACIAIVGAELLYAALPGLLPYQGRLTQPGGSPYAPGNHALKFALTDSSGTQLLWTNDGSNSLPPLSPDSILVTTNGVFAVELGRVHPIPDSLWSHEQLWLRVWFNPGPGYEELLPYQRVLPIGSSHFSDVAQNANLLGGQPGSFYRDWTNLTNIPAGFADGVDNEGGRTFDATVASSGGDYTTIQAAINDGKYSLFVKAGSYSLPGGSVWPGNILVVGEGKDSTVITTPSTFNSGPNSVFQDLKLVINGTSNVLGNGSTVRHCYVEFPSRINGGGTTDASFYGSEIVSTANGVIYTRGRWIGNKITGPCQIYASDGTFFVGNDCTELSYIANNGQHVIQGNRFSASTSNVWAIQVSGAGSTIVANRINGYSTGIFASGRNVISDNVVAGPGVTGIRVQGAGNFSDSQNGSVVSNNVVWGSGLTSNAGIVVELYHVSCHGNTVFGCSGDGVKQTGACVGVAISANVAHHCGGQGFNIGGTGSVQGLSLTGNTSNYNSGDGFWLSASDLAVSGNLAMSNNGAGFRWESNSSVVAVANVALGNSGGNWVGAAVQETGNVH